MERPADGRSGPAGVRVRASIISSSKPHEPIAPKATARAGDFIFDGTQNFAQLLPKEAGDVLPSLT